MAEKEKETGEHEHEQGENKGGNPPDNDSGNGAPGGAGNVGSGNPTEEIRKVVREEIAEALKAMKPGANGDGTLPARPANLEAEAERMVREATAKLEAEKQHKADHEKLREGVKPLETAPQKARRLTRALWGSEDK